MDSPLKILLMLNLPVAPSLVAHLGHRRAVVRPSLILLLSISMIALSGCGLFNTHKKVQVAPLLTPLADANKALLINEVNRLARVKSIHGKVDILFEDTSFAEQGISDKYRQADGTITVQRPGKIYLIIKVPFIATDIAQMTSDGEGFRVAVLQGDEKYKRFVKGTNKAVYQKLDMDGVETDKNKKKTMSGKETVNALANLRPQHLTEAFMVSPILTTPPSGIVFSQSEFYQEEPDTRLQAKKGARVVRAYYVLDELSPPNGDETHLLRRFWFDRVGGIRLARLQTFDEHGLLITDVSYADEKPFGESGRLLPSRIDITRPHDHYRLSITYQAPPSVEIDREFRPEAFVLENRWQLPEVDLDTRQSNRAKVTQ